MPERLDRFVKELEGAVQAGGGEARVLERARAAMAELVAKDDWLPPGMDKPHPQYYQQYLLYADPQDRFSVVSFVWGPGQKTPVHDHTVWGVIGVLRGGERCRSYDMQDGKPVAKGEDFLLHPGEVEAVSPTIGDVHVVANAFDDRVSVSIHAYGANIGKVKRHVFDGETGVAKEFVSGYANA